MEAATIVNRDKGDRAAIEAALRAAGISGPVEFVDGGKIEDRARALVKEGARLVVVGGGEPTFDKAAVNYLRAYKSKNAADGATPALVPLVWKLESEAATPSTTPPGKSR